MAKFGKDPIYGTKVIVRKRSCQDSQKGIEVGVSIYKVGGELSAGGDAF